MINFSEYLKLYKNKNIQITVSTFNNFDTLKFEEFLHELGYLWKSGNKYVLKYTSYNSVLFSDIDNISKTFRGYDLDSSKTHFINDLKAIHHFNLEYPKDILIINRLLLNKPSYKPKKIER